MHLGMVFDFCERLDLTTKTTEDSRNRFIWNQMFKVVGRLSHAFFNMFMPIRLGIFEYMFKTFFKSAFFIVSKAEVKWVKLDNISSNINAFISSLQE